MVRNQSDGFPLETIGFAANEEWLRVLEQPEPLRAAALQAQLGLHRTRTLEQLHRAETLGLLEQVGQTVKGATSYWRTTDAGNRLARAIRLLSGAATDPQGAQAWTKVGVLALVPEASPSEPTEVAELFDDLLQGAASGRRRELFAVRIHHPGSTGASESTV